MDIDTCEARASCGDDVVEACEWAAWSEWTDCSVTCGEGQHQRVRTLDTRTTTTEPQGLFGALGLAERTVSQSRGGEQEKMQEHAGSTGLSGALAVASLTGLSVAVIVYRRRSQYDPLGQQLIE